MISNRREFLEKISVAGLLGFLPSATVSAHDENDSSANAFIAGPYLQNIGTDSATIMWITARNSFSWVEYGKGTYTSMREFGYNNGLIDANKRIHKITLTGLTPGTAYKYKIVSTEVLGYKGSKVEFGEVLSGALLSFKTAGTNDNEVKFVVFNDVHDRPQTIPQLLYRHGYTKNQRDFDFVVFNGDMFDWVTTEQQMIDHLLQPATEVFASEIPFLLTQGNHECRGAFSRNIPDYFSYPENKYYFAFTQGPVRFVVLDSGEDKKDDSVEYGGLAAFDKYRVEQAKWLAREIESDDFRKAAFRVVLIHISPYHSGDWYGTLHCRQVFGPLLNKAKIDIQISGHTHRYAVHDPDTDHNFPVIIGGGPIEGNRTLIKVKINQQELHLQMLRDDGEEVGKYLVKRKK